MSPTPPPPPPPRRTGVFPPPPRMSGATKKVSSPKPHAVSTEIPQLPSAPTSGNLDDFAGLASMASSQLMGVVDSLNFSSSTTATATRPPLPSPHSSKSGLPLPPPPRATVVNLPPPPPPPPLASKPPGATEVSSYVPVTPPVPAAPTSPTIPSRVPPHHFAKSASPATALRQSSLPIYVIGTEHAHQLAYKNELRLADLLSGLLQTTSSSVAPALAPFRSTTKSLPVAWDDLRISFVEDYVVTSDETAAERLQAVAKLQPTDGNLAQELELLEDQIDNLLSEEEAVSSDHLLAQYEKLRERHRQTTKDAFQLTSPLTIPWLSRYRQALDDCTDYLEYDQFHCPVILLFVCTTTEQTNPLETLRSLELHVPQFLRNGMFDPNRVRHEMLVLHDNVHGPKAWDESVLRQQMGATFGSSAGVVRINSLELEIAAQRSREESNDLWGGGGRRGNCLNEADRARLRKYLAQLVSHAVLPAMERRIADLNAVVSERKKGVRNVLKSFWGGRKKEDEEDGDQSPVGSDIQYRFDAIESQTRLLADSLFLMRDYEAAYAVYRLIKDDYKQDKQWTHYGSVQEMMALSLYSWDPYGRAREIFSNVEGALLAYTRAAEEIPSWGQKPGRVTMAPVPTRLATRLCLVLVATRNICAGRHLEVADLLASASSHETSLGAAVLLEQSSAHYFHAEMFRKYAFHMLMSGHMFRSAEQEHHAFRCFTSALHIYRDGKWSELHSHLRSALAAQLFSMGRMAIALQLYAKLLGSSDGGRVSVKSQQKYIENLCKICDEHNKKALACADRMAAASHLSGSERDAVRKERLDRIVQVVRYTRSAARILELPNMNLPLIDDSTIQVMAAEEARGFSGESSELSIGEAHPGSSDIWDELMNGTNAELKASEPYDEDSDDLIMGKTLLRIHHPENRRVIALLEKAKIEKNLAARSKHSVGKAPVRAVQEPILVLFRATNPLGVPLDLKCIQLVAKMVADENQRVCTNEDAVHIRPLAVSNEKRSWNFQGSSSTFEVADFCRISTESGEADKQPWKSAVELDPFFVVTKEDITLKPGSEAVIGASVCPLVEGKFEVVGVRYKMFDHVWVYHPFEVKGPLLQNTRSNRVNRVRGESFLLKSKVERGMPRLTVDLVGDSQNASALLLETQIMKLSLRVSNIGTAAAKNVTLKSNLPWITIPSELQGDWEKVAVSYCIGPTGTLSSLPLKGDSLSTQGEIKPSESIDIPIRIQPNGRGKQDFYMLFRYEHSGEAQSSRISCRWLKKMYTVPVYPSLRLTASVAPSFSKQKEHILSLELANCRTDRPDKVDVHLDKAMLVGRGYTLVPIPGATVTGVGWQERVVYHFRIVATDDDDTDLLMTESTFSTSTASVVENASSTDLLASMCVQKAFNEFTESQKEHQMALARAAAAGSDEEHPRSIASIRRAKSTMSSGPEDYGHPVSILRLCPIANADNLVHLVCSWKDSEGVLAGSLLVRDLAVRPSSRDVGCPLVVTASHPTSVSNDFNFGPASVPLNVTLRNILVDTSVKYEFSLLHPDDFDFTGPSVFQSSLQAGEQQSIPLKAVVPTTGVFNLQKIRLTVEDETRISYMFPLQWMVSVNEA